MFERAFYVERGTMAGGADHAALSEPREEGPAPYFSMVLVPGRQGAR